MWWHQPLIWAELQHSIVTFRHELNEIISMDGAFSGLGLGGRRVTHVSPLHSVPKAIEPLAHRIHGASKF